MGTTYQFNGLLVDAIMQQNRDIADHVERLLEDRLNTHYFCAMARNANQSINDSTTTNILWDATRKDQFGWHDATNTDRIYPSVPGWYHATLFLGAGSTFPTTSRFLAYMVSTTSGNFGVVDFVPGIASPRVTVSGYGYFNGTTDYLVAKIYHDKGSALNVTGNVGLHLID